MRVLQLHQAAATVGGADELMAHEAHTLTEAGHAVDQLVMPASEDLGLSAVRAGLKAVYNREAAREVRDRVESFTPDVVHVHSPFPLMSPAVFRVARAAGVPAVTTLHSYRFSCVVGTCLRDGGVCEDCVGSRLKLAGVRHACYHESRPATAALTLSLGVHRALGTFSSCVSRYLALTSFSRELLVRDGFPPERVVVKPNSVADPGVRAPAPGQERRVVFAGRLVEEKGVRTLLAAWARVSASTAGDPGAGSALRLVIAGDGPLRPLVDAAAAADASVDVRGWVPEAEMPDLLGSAELVVVPSEWYEGAPLVILRSLAVGTPVLVSDLENLATEVLADDAGWTFRTGDPASLAAALADHLGRPERAATARARARASYDQRYSPTLDLARLEALYAEVVAEGVTGP